MKYIFSTILLFLSLTAAAQTEQEIKIFAEEYYEHYKTNDVKWLEKKFGTAQDMIDYSIATFNKPPDTHAPFEEVYIDIRKDYFKSFTEADWRGLRKFVNSTTLVEILIESDKQYPNLKTVYIICKNKDGQQYYIDPGIISKNKKGNLVVHAASVQIEPLRKNGNLHDLHAPSFAAIPKGDSVTDLPKPKKINRIEDAKAISSQAQVFSSVEVMPEFPGGENAMLNFLADNIEYPIIASNAGITGIVYIEFVVKEDGSIDQAKIIRDIGGGCGEAALRVVKKMPKWKPGKNNGKAVRTSFTLPVEFAEYEEEE